MLPKLLFPRIMDERKYRGLSPHDQEEYLERKIQEIVSLNEHGITRGDIDRATPFSRPSIIKHLEKMVAMKKAYKITRGQVQVYYPNGNIKRPEDKIELFTESGSHFQASFLSNEFGDYVFLEDLDTSDISGGSLMIKKSDTENFYNFIKEVYAKFKSDQKKVVYHEVSKH